MCVSTCNTCISTVSTYVSRTPVGKKLHLNKEGNVINSFKTVLTLRTLTLTLTGILALDICVTFTMLTLICSGKWIYTAEDGRAGFS